MLVDKDEQQAWTAAENATVAIAAETWQVSGQMQVTRHDATGVIMLTPVKDEPEE